MPQIFGLIPGIDRVNRTLGDAARLLGEAEGHLASMGIPYVLAVHGELLVAVIEMLREDGRDDPTRAWTIPRRTQPSEVSLDVIHEYVAERCRSAFPPERLELFHLARRVRNRILHFGGEAGSRLPGDYRGMSTVAKADWERLAAVRLRSVEEKSC